MEGKRIAREKESVTKMIKLYCRGKHHTKGTLCDDCQELYEYAQQRLTHCKFAENKPVCGNCPIHCYRKDKREQIKDVMRYVGPRMLFHHPIVAIQHMIDALRKPKE